VVIDGTPLLGGDLPDVRTITPATAQILDESITDVRWDEPPPGVERVWFDAPSGRLAGFALGDPDRPRILLIPGVTGSKEDFALMAPLLHHAGYRVESFDLAGQYESHEAGPEHLDPPRPRYDHDLFVDDLVAVIETGRRPAHVLGYSFAGTIAQLTAVRRPDLVASLTLLSCPPLPGQAFRRVKGGVGAISHFSNGRMGASIMIWGVKNNLNRAPDHRVAFVHKRFELTRRSSVDDIISLMRRTPDVDAQVRALEIPKLVAFGTHDLWPISVHEAFARRIGAQVAIYETGHSPCETAPHQLSRDLVRVIESR